MSQVNVGKIVNTHGIRGDLKVQPSTDFIEERFKKGNKLNIQYLGSNVEVEVLKYRIHKNMILVTFVGLEDINLVEKYKGCMLTADKDEELLDDDEYYIDDLIGLEVIDKGNTIGKVVDVVINPHQSLLVVEGKSKIMIPYVDAFVKEIDLDEGVIITELIEGFYED